MPSELEYQAMSKVITNRNKNKKWIKRAKNPKKHIQNPDGTGSTHRMAYATIDNNRGVVFPTIKRNKEGKLKELSDDEAYENARKGEGVVLPTEDFARYYSEKGYKESTGLLDRKTSPQIDLKPDKKMNKVMKFKKGTRGFPNGKPKKKVKMYKDGTKGFSTSDASKVLTGISALSGNEKVGKVAQIANSGLSILNTIGGFRKGSKSVSTQMKYKCGTRGMKMK